MNRLLKMRVHRTVNVTLKSGEAFQGILWEQDKFVLVFVNARMFTKDGPVEVDGELVVLVADAAYMQFP